MQRGREVLLKVTTTGGAGVSAGSAVSDPITGFIEAVQLDYHASAPSTTDLTVTEQGGLARTLFTFTNNKTDKVFYPLLLAQDTAGADLTAIYRRIFLCGVTLTVTLAQCDDLTNAVVARILISEQ